MPSLNKQKTVYLFYLLAMGTVSYAQTPKNKMVNFYFQKDGCTYCDSLYGNEEKPEMLARKVKSRKTFYHHITSNIADKEYLYELSEYDSLGNEVKKTRFFADGDLSSTEIKTYNNKSNLTQITTRNYCYKYAISCNIEPYYEQFFYYDNNNKIVKWQFFYANKDSVFNKEKSTPLRFEMYKYNAIGKPSESIEIYENDTVSRFQYYYNKNQKLIKQLNYKMKTETNFIYDNKGKPIERKNSTGSFKIVSKYDKDDNLMEIKKLNEKGELYTEHSYSYSHNTYSPQLICYETYIDPDGRTDYNRKTRREYDNEDRLLIELNENDQRCILNQKIYKYNEVGLLIEEFEGFGSIIRLQRYEYEFYK